MVACMPRMLYIGTGTSMVYMSYTSNNIAKFYDPEKRPWHSQNTVQYMSTFGKSTFTTHSYLYNKKALCRSHIYPFFLGFAQFFIYTVICNIYVIYAVGERVVKLLAKS